MEWDSLQLSIASRSARFPVPNVRHRLPTTSHLRTHEAQHAGGLWHNAIGAAKPWLNNLWRRRRIFHHINHVESFWEEAGFGLAKDNLSKLVDGQQGCRHLSLKRFGQTLRLFWPRKFEVAETQSQKQVDWFLWLNLNTFSNTCLARSAAVDLSVAWDAQETKVCGIIM